MSKFRQFEEDDNYYEDDFDNGFDAYKKPVTRLDNNDDLWGEPKKKPVATTQKVKLMIFIIYRWI